jgi:hypothetical protein
MNEEPQRRQLRTRQAQFEESSPSSPPVIVSGTALNSMIDTTIMGIASTTNLALDVVISVLAGFMATQQCFGSSFLSSQIYSSKLDPNVLIRN